ncbi:hypothetical protein [Niallia sp. 03133]|uniref:hypothetical protein n=1 Tax=Niallia sp. 03133 TaxID=3458060 RepID=UPI004044A8A5
MITENRRWAEIRMEEEFVIDRNKLAFKTNRKGELEGTFLLTVNMPEEEKMILYPVMENPQSTLIMEFNGEKAAYHIMDVPKNGKVKVRFTLKGLPAGTHTVYIFLERYFVWKEKEEKNSKQHEIFDPLYFSLEVYDDKDSLFANKYFESVKKVGNADEKHDLFSIKIFEDSMFAKEARMVGKTNYFLLINNASVYEWKGYVKLLADYQTEEIKQIIIPADSMVGLPVELRNHQAMESIRMIFIGEPTKKIDVPFLLRKIFKTKRLPIC